MKLFKTKLTESDEKIKNIVETFLANKETVIDINPEDMSYLDLILFFDTFIDSIYILVHLLQKILMKF